MASPGCYYVLCCSFTNSTNHSQKYYSIGALKLDNRDISVSAFLWSHWYSFTKTNQKKFKWPELTLPHCHTRWIWLNLAKCKIILNLYRCKQTLEWKLSMNRFQWQFSQNFASNYAKGMILYNISILCIWTQAYIDFIADTNSPTSQEAFFSSVALEVQKQFTFVPIYFHWKSEIVKLSLPFHLLWLFGFA